MPHTYTCWRNKTLPMQKLCKNRKPNLKTKKQKGEKANSKSISNSLSLSLVILAFVYRKVSSINKVFFKLLNPWSAIKRFAFSPGYLHVPGIVIHPLSFNIKKFWIESRSPVRANFHARAFSQVTSAFVILCNPSLSWSKVSPRIGSFLKHIAKTSSTNKEILFGLTDLMPLVSFYTLKKHLNTFFLSDVTLLLLPSWLIFAVNSKRKLFEGLVKSLVKGLLLH